MSLDQAREAFEEARYEDVLAVLNELHASDHVSAASVRLYRDTFMRMGELHRALGELNRLRALTPSRGLDRSARHLLGRIIETDPSWLPEMVLPVPTSIPDRTTEKRVLHILKESIPYSETGFTMRSRMTLAAQRLAGFDPHVITSLGFPRNKDVTDFPETEVLDGVTHYRLDPGREVDVSEMAYDIVLERTANLAARIADELGVELVQAGTGYRGYETALVGMALADRYDVPFVYEVRGFQEQTWTGSIERSEKGEYFRRRYDQENRCMDRADLVITIAEAMAEEILNRGVPSEKVAVVPNAVDVSRFSPREKREDLLDRYGLSDRFVVGYISNLGQREGIDNLIRAVGILRSRGHSDLACLVAGDGPQRSSLEDLVRELGLNGVVVLAGHVPNEQIEDHYALIDLFVVPRIYDRAARLVTPLKPLEAMAMGLPVIASSLPALSELVKPGERGMTFPPSDPATLADVIGSLMDNSAERERFANAGQAWVRECRTVDANSEKYERILNLLVA